MKKMRSVSKSTEGGVLIASILTVTVLAAVSAAVLSKVAAKHQDSFQAVAWREALVSAESGVERTMAELRTQLSDPNAAWAGWTVINSDGTQGSVQQIDRDGRWASGYSLRLNETLPAQAGDSRQPRYSVTIDVPASLAPTARRWNQSYRIRSTGYAGLPGMARANYDLAGSGTPSTIGRHRSGNTPSTEVISQ